MRVNFSLHMAPTLVGWIQWIKAGKGSNKIQSWTRVAGNAGWQSRDTSFQEDKEKGATWIGANDIIGLAPHRVNMELLRLWQILCGTIAALAWSCVGSIKYWSGYYLPKIFKKCATMQIFSENDFKTNTLSRFYFRVNMVKISFPQHSWLVKWKSDVLDKVSEKRE